MTGLLVDHFLLTLPEVSSSDETRTRWLEEFQTWWNELLETKLKWWVVRECIEQLVECSKLVSFSGLRSLGLAFDPSKLTKLQREIQTDEHDLRGTTFTKFLVPNQSIEAIPSEVLDRNDESTRTSMELALACLCSDQMLGIEDSKNVRLVTAIMNEASQYLEVCAECDLFDPSEVGQELAGRQISGTFRLMVKPDELHDVPAIQILRLGDTDLKKHIVRKARLIADSERIHELVVKTTFVESILEKEMDQEPTTLEQLFERCAQILADKVPSGARLEQVRVTSSGSSAAVSRVVDGATAWRVSITMGGAAWRMHFWRHRPPGQLGRHTIELANVLRHSDPVTTPE